MGNALSLQERKKKKFLFCTEDTEEFLKAISETLGIREKHNLHDKMYKVLQPKKPCKFPVHQSLKYVTKTERLNPEK